MKRLRDYQKTKIEYDPISFESEKDLAPNYLERSVHNQITLQAVTIAALVALLVVVLLLLIIYLFFYAPNNRQA